MTSGKTTNARGGKSVAVVEDEANLPAVVDYGGYEGAGFEDMGRDDFATPFLSVLQPTSKILVENDEMRPGMLLNTVTQIPYPAEKAKNHPGIVFIPCWRQHIFVEWKKRDEGGNGGGFVAQHEPGSAIVEAAKAKYDFGALEHNGNDLIETFYVYGIHVMPDGTWEHLIIPFTSTKIKPYKYWMTRLNTIQVPGPSGKAVKPPMFAHRFRMNTILEKRDAGLSYNFVIGFDGDNAQACRIEPGSELFNEAAGFYQLCKDGIAKPNYDAPAAQEAGGTTIDGDAIPF